MELANPDPVIVHLAEDPCAAAEDTSRAATAPRARVLLNTLAIVLYSSRGATVLEPGQT